MIAVSYVLSLLSCGLAVPSALLCSVSTDRRESAAAVASKSSVVVVVAVVALE